MDLVHEIRSLAATWWMIVYYPILGLIIWWSGYLHKRHGRNRKHDMAFGCALMGFISLPIIGQIGWLIYQGLR
jgi:hypothetical protein